MTHLTDDDLDRVLREPWLRPDDGFAARVMQQVTVATVPPTASHTDPLTSRLQRALSWLLLGGGALVGSLELVSFVFGAWSATAAL